MGRITLPKIKSYYIPLVIKKVWCGKKWYRQKDKYINQWNRIKGSETDPHKYAKGTE